MTPQARVQAAIEILDAVIAAAQRGGAPADRIITEWFRSRRFAGSKDRRAVRELVYGAVRACGPVPASGRAALLRLGQSDAGQADAGLLALFDGSRFGPAPLVAGEEVAQGGVAPAWLMEQLLASGLDAPAAQALLGRAPLDIRVNALKADRAELVLPEAGEWLAAPQGLRFAAQTPVEQWPAFDQGLIEVQDGGSQLACYAAGAQAGELVIDLCAGAGGKTLALAAAMGNKGTLVACDVDRARLSRLAPRAQRAGAMVAQTVLMNPGAEAQALADYAGRADLVVIDAPCSGTGTWRRNPEARWRLSAAELARVCGIQARLLDLAGQLVRPGGRVLFITCSLLDTEGADQFARFLARQPRAQPRDLHALPLLAGLGERRGAGLRLAPHRDGTDGFFIGLAGVL